MTAFVRAFIFCDGCDGTFDYSTVPSAKKISEARRDAKRYGWARSRDGRDLCEHCAKGDTNRQPETEAAK